MVDLKASGESAAGAWSGMMFHKCPADGKKYPCGFQFWNGGQGAWSHDHGLGFG